jgi:hypothetical protein
MMRSPRIHRGARTARAPEREKQARRSWLTTMIILIDDWDSNLNPKIVSAPAVLDPFSLKTVCQLDVVVGDL